MSSTNGRSARPIRVALLNGVCARYDAMSYSLRLKLELLRGLRDQGQPVLVRAFVQGTDLDDPDIRVCSLRDLLLDPDFAASDLVVYEFGIDYQLFDSLFALSEAQRSIGIYHNLTPLEFVVSRQAREAVERGLLVRHNLARLDHVACDSEFNREDLLECGLRAERLSVLPLPPRVSLPRREALRWSNDPVEVLYVGRMVKAKGVHDLLEAAALLREEGVQDVRLTIAGSRLFSDQDVIDSIRFASSRPGELAIRFVADPSDAALEDLYRSSSILAIPSYHEGYCLPVLEAFHADCQVVAYDAGNLPSIVGGLGQLVPTGDVRRLAAALRRAVNATHAACASGDAAIPTATGEMPVPLWRDAIAQDVAQHSREKYERSFLELVRQLGVMHGDERVRAVAE